MRRIEEKTSGASDPDRGVALVGATALIGYAMRDGINFFRSPARSSKRRPAANEVFRIGGLVVEGSLVRSRRRCAFAVTDGGGGQFRCASAASCPTSLKRAKA